MTHMMLLTALLLLSGCALSPRPALGPDGGPVMLIDGMSTAVAYDKATKACPRGYSILAEPHEMSFINYEMTVECK
jgi:hypothetical protein